MNAHLHQPLSQTSPSHPRPDKKVICIKCSHSFPKTQYQSHSQMCTGRIQKYFYVPEVPTPEAAIIKDIDMLDFPLSKPSVQLSSVGSIREGMIELKTKKTKGTQKEGNCCFCGDLFKTDENCLRLPCEHLLHVNCLKKWLIIVDPCKICDGKFEEETNHTEICSLKNSV